MYRNGNGAKFLLYVSNGKYFKELFTLSLIGIIVDGWYVSFTSIVHNARSTKK